MAAPPNVWQQMNYVPPRGQCNFRASVLSAKCPCLRFMLHPLKSSSSYDCDGCAHHASFHSMENEYEDKIRKRWENEERDKKALEEQEAVRPRKRLRELEYNTATSFVTEEDDALYEHFAKTIAAGEGSITTQSVSSRGKKKTAKTAPTRGRGGLRALRGRAKESSVEADVVELTD